MGQSYGAGLWGRTWAGMCATGLSVMSQEQHYGAALWGRTWGRLMCYGAVHDGVGLSYGAVL